MLYQTLQSIWSHIWNLSLVIIKNKQHSFRLHYEQHTESGWSLEQHWSSETTLELIRKGDWDVVVLQVRFIWPIIWNWNIYIILSDRLKVLTHIKIKINLTYWLQKTFESRNKARGHLTMRKTFVRSVIPLPNSCQKKSIKLALTPKSSGISLGVVPTAMKIVVMKFHKFVLLMVNMLFFQI